MFPVLHSFNFVVAFTNCTLRPFHSQLLSKDLFMANQSFYFISLFGFKFLSPLPHLSATKSDWTRGKVGVIICTFFRKTKV